MAGTFTLSGLKAGLPSGEQIVGPVTDTGTAVIVADNQVTLAAGDNTIAVPVGATHVVLLPGTSNTGELRLRTNLNAADGGTPFGPLGWCKLPLFAGTTSLIVTSSAGGTLEATFI